MCKGVGYAGESTMDTPERDTVEAGIALLTAASSCADDCVDSAYWIELACMSCPYYITLQCAHCLDSEFMKLFQPNLQKLPLSKI